MRSLPALLLLHEIGFPVGRWIGPIFLVSLFGYLTLLVAWGKLPWVMSKAEAGTRRRPPVFRIGGAVALLSIAAEFARHTERFGRAAEWYQTFGIPFAGPFVVDPPSTSGAVPVDTIVYTGVGLVLWLIALPLMRPAARISQTVKPAPTPVPVVLPPDVRSERDTCERCRDAARNEMGQPLMKIAHTAKGPKFLYRCMACRSYWIEEEMTIGRPISPMRARQLFPDAVV